MIKWYGKATNGIWKRNLKADTMDELYHACVDKEIISLVNYDPEEKYIIERAGYDYYKIMDEMYDIADEGGGDIGAALERWLKENNIDTSLSDEDYFMIISSERGNAYYQTFEDENGNEIEFDENGTIIPKEDVDD